MILNGKINSMYSFPLVLNIIILDLYELWKL